jgi:hypothetical protein
LTQAQASRHRMLGTWYGLTSRTEAAAWWVAKAGADHYAEHLPRLRRWVSTLRRERLRNEAQASGFGRIFID